jgi:methionine-rich copper-binding protein CopC
MHLFHQRGFRILLIILALAGLSHAAWAHAILMESTPKVNTTVKGPDVPVTLRFNVRVDGSRSRLHLVDPAGAVHSLPITKQPSPDVLQAEANELKAGAYKLQWQVLASDGHISRGEVAFTVN